MARIGKRMVALALIVGALTAAHAPDRRFAGTWRIDSAARAPWSQGEVIAPGEDRRLIGKRVVFGRGRVDAPPPLGCGHANYRVREHDGADMLFQGMLAENGPAHSPAAAPAAARLLGMATPTVPTLETGCEIEYHALRPGTLMFGLNDRIYTLVRIAPK
jgi:hypothetical protein